MTHRVDAETESDRKLLLRHSQPAANGPYIDFGRDVDDIGTLLGGSLGKGEGLLEPPDDALGDSCGHNSCSCPVCSSGLFQVYELATAKIKLLVEHLSPIKT